MRRKIEEMLFTLASSCEHYFFSFFNSHSFSIITIVCSLVYVSLIKKCVQEHKSTFNKSSLRDVVDIYINAQQDRGFDDYVFAGNILKESCSNYKK